MRYPHATYSVPQHSFTVRVQEGALFLDGSMDERLAMPPLLNGERPGASAEETGVVAAESTGDSRGRCGIPVGGLERVSGGDAEGRFEELLKVFHAATDERDFGPFMEIVEKTPMASAMR
jgi:hypothetical protein